ncbi:MAG: hypothetical protein QXR53_00975 [Candidatus Norongarragalinales archaeon]
MDFTKIMEWDELRIVLGVLLMLFGQFDIGFWVAILGLFMFLTTEGYLSF